jgi:predicted metalloprotease with PDZ domain
MSVIKPFKIKLSDCFLLIGLFFTIIIPLSSNPKNELKISYVLDVHKPYTHLFKVTMKVDNVTESYIDVAIPAWMPGYNRVRNFARNIQELSASESNSQKLNIIKLDKQTWRVFKGKEPTIKLTYKVYANNLHDINIGSHIDETHAFFNGASVFLYVVDAENTPVKLTIKKPKTWKIATGLESTTPSGPFYAGSYDELIDCPTEIGNFARFDFFVKDKPHHLVFYGCERIDVSHIKKDIIRIVETCSNLFGNLPYKEYTFIYHLTYRERRSGVEHSNSTAISFNREDFLAGRNYDHFISVTAHEFFHLWNIKRIRPEGWGPFCYREVPLTKSHWFTEGITSYYTSLILVRAGIWSKEKFYQDLTAKISEFEKKPAKKIMSLEEASLNITLKPDNALDTTISYYIKGAVVAFLLDCEIRKRTSNQKSLDDVLRYLNENYAKKNRAYKNQELLQIINHISESDFSDFYRKYIAGTADIPYQEFLQSVGLKLVITEEKLTPYLGIETEKAHDNFVIIKYVAPDSPAYKSGIIEEDILLALNGQRLNFSRWRDLLNMYGDEKKITLTLFHRDRLIEKEVEIKRKTIISFQIQEVDDPNADQLRLRVSLFGLN